MNRKLAVLVILLGATVALAASYNVDNIIRLMKAGALIGRGVQSTDTDVLTSSSAGTIDFDFPADGGCQRTPKIACPRCRVGDPCIAGRNVTASATSDMTVECFVASYDGGTASIDSHVIIQACPHVTTVDPNDAGYYWRVFSNQ
jgi:hypothetical protein